MSSKAEQRYDPAYHFKKDLKNQRCACFNTFCCANLLLLIWLAWNIVYILGITVAVYAVYSPYGSIKWPCDEGHDGDTEYCDLREILETRYDGDSAKATGITVFWLVIQIIITLINFGGFIGLWNCIPWMILLTIFIALLGIVFACIGMILSQQYYWLFILIIPIFLICYFINIWQTAKKHTQRAKGYQNVQYEDV